MWVTAFRGIWSRFRSGSGSGRSWRRCSPPWYWVDSVSLAMARWFYGVVYLRFAHRWCTNLSERMTSTVVVLGLTECSAAKRSHTLWWIEIAGVGIPVVKFQDLHCRVVIADHWALGGLADQLLQGAVIIQMAMVVIIPQSLICLWQFSMELERSVPDRPRASSRPGEPRAWLRGYCPRSARCKPPHDTGILILSSRGRSCGRFSGYLLLKPHGTCTNREYSGSPYLIEPGRGGWASAANGTSSVCGVQRQCQWEVGSLPGFTH